jgi:hypothetical protein
MDILAYAIVAPILTLDYNARAHIFGGVYYICLPRKKNVLRNGAERHRRWARRRIWILFAIQFYSFHSAKKSKTNKIILLFFLFLFPGGRLKDGKEKRYHGGRSGWTRERLSAQMSKEKGATVEMHSNVPKKHIDRNGIDAALDKKEKNEYHKSFEKIGGK